jgi:hypothetical protein
VDSTWAKALPRSNFTIPGSITSPASSRIRSRTWDYTSSRNRRRTSESSRRRRCATSR